MFITCLPVDQDGLHFLFENPLATDLILSCFTLLIYGDEIMVPFFLSPFFKTFHGWAFYNI